MKCNSCGAELRVGERFCSACGAPNNTRQPSREEVRARVQGGGRHAAPGRNAASARRAAPVSVGLPTVQDKSKLFWLGACVLGVLQIIYLFVKTLYISFLGESESFSLLTALKEGEAGFLSVLLVLLSIGVLASIAAPVLLSGRPRPVITIALSAAALVLYIVCVVAVNRFFDEEFFGIKPKLGFFGWMFILNCVLIPVLIFLSGGEGGVPAPTRTAVPRRAAVRQAAPARRSVNGASRPGAPAQTVTPPDAETIAALRRMAQMHSQGLVSDEEFARIKAECVARGWIRE